VVRVQVCASMFGEGGDVGGTVMTGYLIPRVCDMRVRRAIRAHCNYGMGNGVENPSGPERRKNVLQVATARFLSGSSFASHPDF
jgi:hypothetical protein